MHSKSICVLAFATGSFLYASYVNSIYIPKEFLTCSSNELVLQFAASLSNIAACTIMRRCGLSGAFWTNRNNMDEIAIRSGPISCTSRFG